MKNLLTWDVCRPIRTSDVTAGGIIATHTFFFVDLSWLIMTTLSIIIPHVARHLPALII